VRVLVLQQARFYTSDISADDYEALTQSGPVPRPNVEFSGPATTPLERLTESS